MPVPCIGEIRMFAGTFAPAGWMFCEGQLLPIAGNEVLFQLIGTAYGGDGETTFALPDLRGRIPVHQGNGFPVGLQSGAESVALTVGQLPAHTHRVLATGDPATDSGPTDRVPAASTAATVSPYGTDAPYTTLNASAVSGVGGSQPHANVQPYLCINFIISLSGITPSPT